MPKRLRDLEENKDLQAERRIPCHLSGDYFWLRANHEPVTDAVAKHSSSIGA